MSAISDAVEMTLQELEQEITCGICREYYNDPKILPCLHYYCKECVLRLALRNGRDKPFSCPECRKLVTLPEEGENNFKTAFFVNRFKTKYFKQKKILSKVRVCDFCHGPDVLADSFCLQCDKFACRNCVHMHSVMKGIFDSHEVVCVDDVPKINSDKLNAVKLVPKKCPTHQGVLKIFCFECRKTVCTDCVVKGHRGHKLEFIDGIVQKKKMEIKEKLKPLEDVGDRLKCCLEEVLITQKNVRVQSQLATEKIETWYKAFHKMLETQKNGLLNDINARVKRKMDALEKQETDLSDAYGKVLHVVEYTERYMRHSSDEEFVNIYTGVRHQLKQVLEHSRKELEKEHQPMEDADVGVEVATEASFAKVLEKNRVFTLPISVEIDRTCTTADIHEEFLLPVEINQGDSPVYRKVEIDCQIKRFPDDITIQPKLRRLQHGIYLIAFTPEERGRYQFNISVNGLQIESPFEITVQRHSVAPHQLCKPILTWHGFTHPKSVAHNSVGDIIVAGTDDILKIWNSEGSLLKKMQLSVQDIAVDGEDSIIAVNYSSPCIKIVRSKKHSYRLEVVAVNPINGPGHIGVATYGDEVMVTECFNRGSIVVYNKHFKFVKHIQGQRRATFRHLRPDRYGNLYVTDEAKAVQVLSREGDLLRTIGKDSVGNGWLKDPWMLSVFNEFVYVADAVLGRTLLFTTEGEYEATFGCYGGVSVDKDGFVCIGNFHQDTLHFY